MKCREFELPDALSDTVQLMWGMKSEFAKDRFPRERILPDGIVELVFHVAAPLRTIRADGSSYLQPQAFAISQRLEFIEIESTQDVDFIAVRFYPWGAHHYFDVPIGDFVDSYAPVSHLWPDQRSGLEPLADKSLDWAERTASLAEFLNRCRLERQRDPEVDLAIRQVRDSGGQISVSELCDQLDVSDKHLQRKFVAAVGATPKTFARVSRFLQICNDMSKFRGKKLAELAQHCGYSDQSHFNKDFKQFSGFTPKEFFRRNNIGFADI